MSVARWLAPVLLVAALLLWASPMPAQAPPPPTPTFAVMAATFPYPVWSNAAVWAGPYAYIFAGGFSDGVFRYDAATDTLTQMNAQFATGRYGQAAAWDGANTIYLLGGLASNPPANCGSPWSGPMANNVCRQIWAYDIAADTLTMLPAQLPQRMMDMGAFWDPPYVYTVGGCTESWPCPILRFDPAAGTVTPMSSSLDVIDNRLVWTGSEAYTVGGWAGAAATGNIWRYVPATDTLTLVGALPSPRTSHEAILDGPDVYVLGGTPSSTSVYGYVLPGVGASLLPATLPIPATRTSAVEGGPYVGYLFGAGANSDQVVCVGCPDPNAPQPPAFTWSIAAESCDDVTVQFSDQSGAPPTAQHFWEFGDGATSGDASPSHTYGQAGTYQVTMAVVTPDGTWTYSLAIQIPDCPHGPQPPQRPEGPPAVPRDGSDGTIGGGDIDGDGIADRADNCPTVANHSQADLDRDGAGDECDRDRDADDIPDANDNCVTAVNTDQRDTHGGAAGDACDDTDGDLVLDAFDNCPFLANADQADTDRDGVGDACPAATLAGPRSPVAASRGLERPRDSVSVAGRAIPASLAAAYAAVSLGLLLGLVAVVLVARRRAD